MKHSELIRRISEDTGCSVCVVDAVIGSMIGMIIEHAGTEKIVIRNLGCFSVVQGRSETKGRNLHTGEEIIIKPRRRLKFKASAATKGKFGEG